jgi:hypothetical protein
MGNLKFYVLYDSKDQKKLLTTADSDEKMKSETEYYTSGVWFSFDTKENSNLLENEKEIKGIKFPAEPKQREYGEFGLVKNDYR